MRSFAADGNFKADHIKQKNDNDDVPLTNGEGFMTNAERYKTHLASATEIKQISDYSTYPEAASAATHYDGDVLWERLHEFDLLEY